MWARERRVANSAPTASPPLRPLRFPPSWPITFPMRPTPARCARSLQALIDLQRGGRSGAKIEHILPHLENGGATPQGGSALRATSPDPGSKPRVSQEQVSSTGRGAGTSGGSGGVGGGVGATPIRTLATRSTPAGFSPENAGGVGAGEGGEYSGPAWAGGGGSALTSIANPGLVASSSLGALPSSTSKGSSNAHSFRGRGGAFGMLLHKVQAGQPVKPAAQILSDAGASVPIESGEQLKGRAEGGGAGGSGRSP